MTQGEQLARILKRRPMTYGDMLALRVSTSPQKRVAEWLDTYAATGWTLKKGRRADGLVTWRIVRNTSRARVLEAA